MNCATSFITTMSSNWMVINTTMSRVNFERKGLSTLLLCTLARLAAEMRGLAFQLNTIHFTTVCPESERLKAGRFHEFMKLIDGSKYEAFTSTGDANLRNFRTPEIVAKLAQIYPQLLQDFDEWNDNPYQWEYPSDPFWREVPSVRRELINEGVKLLSANPDFLKTLADWKYTKEPDFVRSSLFLTTTEPWIIPSESLVLEMRKLIRGRPVNAEFEPKGFWKRIKWRFSAASASIRFLNSIPNNVRLQIRKMSLNEDHPSIANPECHMLGLIPFCLQNPQMFVERRVDLWRTVVGGDCHLSLWSELEALAMGYEERFPRRTPADLGYTACLERKTNSRFSAWIAEASILPAAGISASSFSLIFDGNALLDESFKMLELFKVKVTWQAAMNQWYVKKSINSSEDEQRSLIFSNFSTIPQAVNDMIKNKSFIHCNFPVSQTLNVEELVDENWNLANGKEWDAKFRRKHLWIPPWPSDSVWRETRLEEIFPET